MTHRKLIDDATIGEAIPLDSLTKLEDEDKWIKPLRQRESRQLLVPEGLDRTKVALEEVITYAKNNFMKINQTK